MSSSSKNYLNLILAIGFGIVWAFFWAIDGTLAYVLFGTTCFFLVLFFYKQFAVIDEHSGNYDKSGSYQGNQAQSFRKSKTSLKVAPKSTVTSIESLKRMAITVTVITLMALGAAFYYFIWNTQSSQLDLNPYDAYTKAEEFYSLQQYDSAYYYYKNACDNDEYLDEAWLGLGNTHYMQLRYDSALYFYQKASQADEEAFQPKYSIAWWYFAQDQFQQSIDKVRELEFDYAQQGDLWQLLGDNYYELGNHNEALPNYVKAYEIGNRSRWLCHVMAFLYDKNGDVEMAIPLYKEALTFDDSTIEIYTRLGELLPGNEGYAYRARAAELQLSNGR
jgi:tetratricopeptide (TPR) repeat protein